MAVSSNSKIQANADASMAETPGWHVLAVLSLLMGFASISTDLYLPAMPAMSRSLHADAGMVEFTISGYLIGFSLGQLIWGPIGDRYGRRISVAIGLVLFVVGSAGCALSGNALAIIGWRMVQALGACASVALSRAMVRDLYDGNRAAQMLSTLITVMAIAPLIGPLVGGQIVAISGWRAIFWTLVCIGLLTLPVLFTIPETLPASRRNRESVGLVMKRYTELLGHRRLLGYAGTGGFLYAGMFAYISGTPFACIDYYQVTAQLYGLLFVFVSTTGFIVANSITGALEDFPERAGTVSALIGAIQYGSGIVGSGLVGAFADGTPWPMGWVIGISGIGSLLCMGLLSSVPTASKQAKSARYL